MKSAEDKTIFLISVVVPIAQLMFFILSGGFTIGSSVQNISAEIKLVNYRLEQMENKFKNESLKVK